MNAQTIEHKLDTVVRDCIAVRMRLLNRVITKIYDDALRPLGLKTSQANVLVAAWKLGTVNPLKLCQALHLDASTLSRNVERMRGKGWLEIVATSDAREQPFRLTARGKRLLEKALPAWERSQAQAARLIGDEGIAWLKKTAEALGMPRST